MSAAVIAEVSTMVDVYSAEDRVMLEARWKRAGRDLDEARRHVEIAVGLLHPLVRFDLITTFVARWVNDALDELALLDLTGELPRGDR